MRSLLLRVGNISVNKKSYCFIAFYFRKITAAQLVFFLEGHLLSPGYFGHITHTPGPFSMSLYYISISFLRVHYSFFNQLSYIISAIEKYKKSSELIIIINWFTSLVFYSGNWICDESWSSDPVSVYPPLLVVLRSVY